MTELQWLEFLKKNVAKGKGVLTGIGDDCAVVRCGKETLLLKSDMSLEDRHFTRKMPMQDIGRRAAARVLSDFAAMAGLPIYIGVSAGLPKWVDDKKIKDLLKGILHYAKIYNYSLVGGDTSRADKLFLDVWAVGKAKKPVLRSTAKDGDYVFITGPLGARQFHKPFEPRLETAQYLAKNFKINAMIDISDGFSLDLYRILQASKKGGLVFQDKLPLTKGLADLNRGEDYELIFTVDKDEPRLARLAKDFYLVARVMPQTFGFKIQDGCALSKVKIKGYTHF